MTIDRAVLAEITDRLAEAAGAIERLNGHVLAIARAYSCTATALSSGKSASGCSNN
ncbi:hypothetical protein [Sphingomonas morindae]|uniref:Uncharacterized protein n=1 Tax=Sphingomonas morindae TaxID=1541170 RepID=A0ABY4X3Y2_9SPHN|nr:hypothetical protein [Sphingomonas morindae]USI71601.1 hypothetical protein LHA26_09655 [Sphingomonas morindae]